MTAHILTEREALAAKFGRANLHGCDDLTDTACWAILTPKGRENALRSADVALSFFARRSPVGAESAPVETCRRCQGNGEVVTDWDVYRHPPEGAPGDAGTADCPDCAGRGEIAAPPVADPVRSDVSAEQFRALYRAYVRLLEIGRDRIMALGGSCDAVDRMEEGDPALIAARSAIAALPTAPAPAARAEPLWAVHIRGADEYQAAASYDAAVELLDWCSGVDRENAADDNAPRFAAVIALWPSAPDEHARDLAAVAAKVVSR